MTKTKRNRRMGKKTQKLWPMRGCYKQRGGSCGCGLQGGGVSQRGGVRQMGGKRRRVKGGGMTLSPSPFVNPPTLPAAIQTWPGVQGAGTGNWLTKNQLPVDVSDRTAVQERAGSIFPYQMGGKRKRKRTKTKRGRSMRGGLDLVNMATYGLANAYSTLLGSANMPVNPQPTVQFLRK
uniref:Uncharacterized protein n=1 Tax=viral metagenome TaxID=1070528 RepID=A0A6C0LBC9_9ZZZZ